MKKIYLVLTILINSAAIGFLVYDMLKNNPEFRSVSTTSPYPDVYLDDEEYLIYPSDSTDKWNIVFPGGDEFVNLKPEQIALFLKSGEINPDTTWVIYPQCEYQLTMEDKDIIIEDFGRQIIRIPYNQAGKIGQALLKDNE